MKISTLFTGILIALACIFSCSKNTPEVHTLSTAFAGAYPAPPLRTYPSSSQEIYGWIKAMDNTKIRAHAWDIMVKSSGTTKNRIRILARKGM